MSLQARVFQSLDGFFPDTPPASLGVAVSGGGDSIALLALCLDWADGRFPVTAICVDHGLRRESAEEARWVETRAAAMGAGSVTLHWRGWDGQGNLQAAARDARYGLMRDWAEAQATPPPIMLGHTRDDQAETVLMRLARGSGVDGLAAMGPGAPGARFLRPLLDVARADLRDLLRDRDLPWLEDPSNDDAAFDRVKARRALDVLAPLGLDADRLAATARHMARAQTALEARAADVAARVMDEPLPGVVAFDRAGLSGIEEETALRLLAHALTCVSGAPYRPRLSALEDALGAALAGTGRTLHGCRIVVSNSRFHVTREFNAVADAICPADGVTHWDGRWRISAKRVQAAEIRALGEAGASAITDRPAGIPRAALVSYPGIWSGPALVAAPQLWHPALCHGRYDARPGVPRSGLSH